MSGLSGTVWIAEEDELDDVRGGIVWTGRFRAHHDTGGAIGEELEDVTAARAIAWGRERAPLVWIRRCDSDYFAAGSDHEPWAVRWDPAEQPARRRPPGEAWRDRAEDAERIAWAVQVDLSPPFREPRPDWDAEVAHIAKRGGATGWRAREITNGAGPDEAWLVYDSEDHTDRTMLTAPFEGPHGGFDTTTYRLEFTLDAATAIHAMEYGIDRCLVAPGWSAVAWARPLTAALPA